MLRVVLIAGVALALLAGSAQAVPTWLAPAPVSWPMTILAEDIDVASDGSGGATAVWSRRLYMQAAVRDPGGTWGEVQTLYTGDAAGARVAMSAAGEALAVWTENAATVRASLRAPGKKFGPGFDVSSSGPEVAAPAVAMAPGGAATVLWRRGATIQAVARDVAGGQLGFPETLSAAGATAVGDPLVTISPTGEATAVWREGDATVAVATRPARGQWSIVRPWTGTEPYVTSDANGAPVVAWHAQDRLWFARRVAGGWTAPIEFGPGRFSTEIGLDNDGTVAAIAGDNVRGVRAAARTPDGTLREVSIGESIESDIDYRAGFAAGFRGGTMAYYNSGDSWGWAAVVRPSGGTFGRLMHPSNVGLVILRTTVVGDDEGNAVAVWQQFEAAGWRITSADYDGAPPRLSDVAIPERVTVGDEVTMSATAADRLSGATITWQFGDGADGIGGTVSHAYADPGDREITVTARDGVGNAVSRTATIRVLERPVFRPPPVIDADGDGFSPPQDCDDTRSSVRPGKPEVPGNAVDENCDGLRVPYPTVGAAASLTTQRLRDRTTLLLTLRVRDLDAGDTVRVRCTGRGCKKAIKHAQTARRPVKTLDLTRLVKRVKLRAGAKIEVRVSHPGRITRVFTFVMRSGGDGSPRRVRECEAPDGGRRSACQPVAASATRASAAQIKRDPEARPGTGRPVPAHPRASGR